MAIAVPIEPLSPELRLEATREMIAQLEAIAGLNLPDDYRRFLIQHGGSLLGDLDHDVVVPFLAAAPIGKVAYPEVVLGFYSKPGDPYDVRSAATTYLGRIPANTFAIAYALGGDLVLLSCEGADRGSVYLWDHGHRVGVREKLHAQALRELEEHGVDVKALDAEQAVARWEQLHAEEIARPPGYRGLYLLSRSLEGFLDTLVAVPSDLGVENE